MLKLLKDLFGFKSEYKRPDWPEKMMTGVAQPINPAPPCPPAVESENFKKAKEILKSTEIDWSCCRKIFNLGYITLFYWEGCHEKDWVGISYKGSPIKLNKHEGQLLADIWLYKEIEALKKKEKEFNAEFLKLNLNDIAGNKTTD